MSPKNRGCSEAQFSGGMRPGIREPLGEGSKRPVKIVKIFANNNGSTQLHFCHHFNQLIAKRKKNLTCTLSLPRARKWRRVLQLQTRSLPHDLCGAARSTHASQRNHVGGQDTTNSLALFFVLKLMLKTFLRGFPWQYFECEPTSINVKVKSGWSSFYHRIKLSMKYI